MLPSSVWTQHREVKQVKSWGSRGTTVQGKGKGSEEEGGRGRTQGGGTPMGTMAYGERGQGKVEREGWGKEEEEGHMVARGRWAPPPMEGKGAREGQQMAIGQ